MALRLIRGKISHAQLRCLERYGVRLELDDISAMEHTIGTSGSMFVRCEGEKGEVWDVCHRGNVYRVAYAPPLRKIMTFLPRYSKPAIRAPEPTLAEVLAVRLVGAGLRDRVRVAWSVLRGCP